MSDSFSEEATVGCGRRLLSKHSVQPRSTGLFLLVVLAAGCGKPAAPLSESARLGQKTYMSVCVACHNVDPRFPGATGPELQGASLELLRAKVRSQGYPPGYKPKRQTKDMPAFAQVTDAELAGLHAFLNHPR